MATFTPAAETSTVNILPRVTTIAPGRQTDFFLRRLFMAGQALQSFMRSIQLKIRLTVMIKPPQLPTIGVMTGFTHRPQTPLVRILIYVAIHAF